MFPDLTRDDVIRLETSRLWLRWPLKDDCAQIAHLARSPAVIQRSGIIPHARPFKTVMNVVDEARRINREGEGVILAITPKDRPYELIGMVGVATDEDVPLTNYWLGRPYWGQGLTTEAVRALSAMIFNLTAIERLESVAARDNPASCRVLEKAGFVPLQTQAHGSLAHKNLPVDDVLLPQAFVLTRDVWCRLGCEKAPVTGPKILPLERMSTVPPASYEAVWSGTALHT
jgi:RimJ/RimL family protein N-acetyltransferase